MTYSEKLKDPRWQKKRLEILEAADWKCQFPPCESPKTETLHVHHRLYLRGRMPWEYAPWCYEVLCDHCHAMRQEQMEKAHSALARFDGLQTACECVFDSDEKTADRLVNIFCELATLEDGKTRDAALNLIESSLFGFGAAFSVGFWKGQGDA